MEIFCSINFRQLLENQFFFFASDCHVELFKNDFKMFSQRQSYCYLVLKYRFRFSELQSKIQSKFLSKIQSKFLYFYYFWAKKLSTENFWQNFLKKCQNFEKCQNFFSFFFRRFRFLSKSSLSDFRFRFRFEFSKSNLFDFRFDLSLLILWRFSAESKLFDFRFELWPLTLGMSAKESKMDSIKSSDTFSQSVRTLLRYRNGKITMKLHSF